HRGAKFAVVLSTDPLTCGKSLGVGAIKRDIIEWIGILARLCLTAGAEASRYPLA
ncbi:hypothetical protein HAX54_001458, partial [Datura stramonium]|nr:hypothetical protein [Datura stramonium]